MRVYSRDAASTKNRENSLRHLPGSQYLLWTGAVGSKITRVLGSAAEAAEVIPLAQLDFGLAYADYEMGKANFVEDSCVSRFDY